MGQVFMYTVESDRHNLADLRTTQDFTIKQQLSAVPGVAEVASIGGYVMQHQVNLNLSDSHRGIVFGTPSLKPDREPYHSSRDFRRVHRHAANSFVGQPDVSWGNSPWHRSNGRCGLCHGREYLSSSCGGR